MQEYTGDHHPGNGFRGCHCKEAVTDHPCNKAHDQNPFDAKAFKEPGHEQEKKYFRHLPESHLECGIGNIGRFEEDRNISKITCKGYTDKQEAKYKNKVWPGSKLLQYIETKQFARCNFFTGPSWGYMRQCKTVKPHEQAGCTGYIHRKRGSIAV